MSVAIPFYRTLTKQLENQLAFLGDDYQFSYRDNANIERNLEITSVDTTNDNQLIIQDEECNWDADHHNLVVQRTALINNPAFLFGENGIAEKGAKIGIALSWQSKTSNQRGITEIADLTGDVPPPFKFTFRHEFYPGQLRGTVSFEIILYLKKSYSNKSGFAENSGTVLGVLDTHSLSLDGNGSIFPIVEVNEKAEPLWWVVCDWTDALSDAFIEDNVRIVLNKGHKHADMLTLKKGIKNSPLLMDIISSSIQIIIQKAKESDDWEYIKNGQDVEQGSIAQAIHYFINTFDWDISSPDKMARTLREDLEKRL